MCALIHINEAKLGNPTTTSLLTIHETWLINLSFSRSRFLRNKDRDLHMYPKLFYPELYLIEGGYKAFFSKCKVT